MAVDECMCIFKLIFSFTLSRSRDRCVDRCDGNERWSWSRHRCLDRCNSDERWSESRRRCVDRRPDSGVLCIDFGEDYGEQSVRVEGTDMYWWLRNRADPPAEGKAVVVVVMCPDITPFSLELTSSSQTIPLFSGPLQRPIRT